MILGSGSASFEILRYLAEHLPVMITPKWVRMPGEALLEITITPVDSTHCRITLLSRFLPKGIGGILYWYALYPFHQYVFIRMLKGLVNAAGAKLTYGPWRFTPKIS